MHRIFGVVSLLGLMYIALFIADFENAAQWSNLKKVLHEQAFYGVLTIAVGVLIISGGIDLSIGSVVGFSAVGFGVLMRRGTEPLTAMFIVLAGGIVIGLINGLLITRLKLQPFLVTLCGLFVYRGLARTISPGQPVGLQEIIRLHPDFAESLDTLRQLFVGRDMKGVLSFPMEAVILLIIALMAALVLNGSVYGRYWYAIGRNEQAARYAGIRTDRQRLVVYVLCSFLSSFGGILALLYYSSATPESMGDSWELYAITGAVLGGCSLRGGEGTIIGMVLGAAVLPLLKNLISFVGSTKTVAKYIENIDSLTPALIGLTLLAGTIADEFFRKRACASRLTNSALYLVAAKRRLCPAERFLPAKT